MSLGNCSSHRPNSSRDLGRTTQVFIFQIPLYFFLASYFFSIYRLDDILAETLHWDTSYRSKDRLLVYCNKYTLCVLCSMLVSKNSFTYEVGGSVPGWVRSEFCSHLCPRLLNIYVNHCFSLSLTSSKIVILIFAFFEVFWERLIKCTV